MTLMFRGKKGKKTGRIILADVPFQLLIILFGILFLVLSVGAARFMKHLADNF